MTEEPVTRGERTREEILQAAQRLFIDRGFHGASMRQIAAEAGIALGGIYNHFSSKEEIFIGVLTERHPLFDMLPAMNAAQGETIEEIVRNAATLMVAGMSNQQGFLNLMFVELVEFKGEHLPQLFTHFYPPLMELGSRFMRGKGELRPLPLPILVRAFIGLFFSYKMTEMIIAQQLSAEFQEHALDHFIEIFLHGILLEPILREGLRDEYTSGIADP